MPSLLLHPHDPCWVPGDCNAFVTSLGELGLIEVPRRIDCADSFGLGSKFLALVMFLGCSPRVAMDPQQGGDAQPVGGLRCQVHPAVSFVSARRPKPRCPYCRVPAGSVDVSAYDGVFTCRHCGRTSTVAALDWRQAAGFGRCFLSIDGIYPHEAVPSDKLLGSLSSQSGCDWRYCYID